MKQANKRVIVDAYNLDADFYGTMTKEDAIAQMKKDNFVEGKDVSDDWYGQAWEKLAAAVDKKAEKETKAVVKEEKAIGQTMQATAKAVEGKGNTTN